MNVLEAFAKDKKGVKGKPFQLEDGTGRSGVITSTTGLYFPRKEEGEDESTRYVTVVFNKPGGGFTDPEEIAGEDLERMKVRM